ncbi:hypothetical protein [Nonomuraea roseoviolacea]|uniref:Uncharacterized protein n=1 Tax=Nonomuraea roseoviolacea subsp. carminata TaxID=160689 RepID=A0ABT1K9F2_9ACTN|nr:hypothetical protein [Nonomuraea roseoviolacea]MCP2350648.1 hypothetical protein [Nonomuraea roseoviolacea subsp. carminata]
MTGDDLMAALGRAPIQFWTCPNPAHLDVTWTGDVATCDTCQLTSEMTGRKYAIARQIERERIAKLLRRVAAGRREYADGAPDDMRRVLLIEADDFESAARIAEGDMLAVCALLPSWRWTEAEERAARTAGGGS